MTVRARKKLKAMTQPPLPHPLQLIVVALSVASLSFNDNRRSPRSPCHRFTISKLRLCIGNERASDSGPRR
jgi:hypothetical protein